MSITKYELNDMSQLEAALNILQDSIDKELKSSSRDMLCILYWQLKIMEIRFEMLSRRINNAKV
jgi:hypothetical protein